MASATSNQHSEQSWNRTNFGSILLGVGLLAGTLYLLYLGFKFLQTPEVYVAGFIDPLEQPLALKSIITLFAIVWGVAGMAIVFYLLNLIADALPYYCLLYTSPSPRDKRQSRMPSSA